MKGRDVTTGDANLEVTKRAPLALRLIYPREMETLLHYNGYQVVDRYGDWNVDPLKEDSRFAIYLCRKSPA